MKKIKSIITLFASALLGVTASNAEGVYQIPNGNADMEWEADNEPGNGLHSFKNATLGGSSFLLKTGKSSAQDLCYKETGRTGNAVAIKSKKVAGIAKANGNLTTGNIIMGSTTPANKANHNETRREMEADGSLEFAGLPDSIEFYSKYSKGESGDYNGNVNAFIHGDCDYADPMPDGYPTKEDYVVAFLEFPITPSDDWMRFSGAFEYYTPAKVNLANDPRYLLLNMTTNPTPGGSAGDVLIVDDIRFIYNSKLQSLTYDGVDLLNGDKDAYKLSVDGEYDESKLAYSADGKGASVETAYDATSKVLSITVNGNDIAVDAKNTHVYEIEFKSVVIPQDTIVPGPQDTIVPGPQDTIVPGPQDTIVPGPQDTIVPGPQDTIVPGPQDTIVPGPQDTIVPGPQDTIVPGPQDTIVPGPQDTIVPGPQDTIVPGPQDTIVPGPQDTIVPGPQDTIVPGPQDTIVPGPQDTIVPGPQDTIVPGPQDTIVPGPQDTIVPGPQDTLLPDTTIILDVPTAKLLRTVVYTDDLVINISGDDMQPQTQDITVAYYDNGYATLSIMNFIMGEGEDGMLVGDIVLDSVPYVQTDSIRMQILKKIFITSDNPDAMGNMLPEIPVEIKSATSSNNFDKLKAIIGIDLEDMYVTVNFGFSDKTNTGDVDEEIHDTVPTPIVIASSGSVLDNMTVSVNGESYGVRKGETRMAYADGKLTLTLVDLTVDLGDGDITVGDVEIVLPTTLSDSILEFEGEDTVKIKTDDIYEIGSFTEFARVKVSDGRTKSRLTKVFYDMEVELIDLGMTFNVSFGDSTTAVINILSESDRVEDTRVFTIMGTYVSENIEDMNSLPAGIYIRDRKKYIIRK